jgi:hypothetical protein
VSVQNLADSVRFYSELFAAKPAVLEEGATVCCYMP